MVIGGERRAFSQAVALMDHLTEGVLPIILYLDVERGGGREEITNVVEAPLDVFYLQQPVVHCRYPEKHAHLILRQGRKYFLGIEPAVQNQSRSGIDRGVHDEVLAEAVEKRQVAYQSVTMGHPRMMVRGINVRYHISVG